MRTLSVLPILAAVLGASPLGAQTLPLTPAQVDCNRAQLEALAARANVVPGDLAADKATNLVLTFGTPDGGFAGLGYTSQYERLFDIEVDGNTVDFLIQQAETPEHHLWFSTNPDEVRLLRNPARPKLDSISATRNRLNSDLVPAGDADELAVTLNPPSRRPPCRSPSWRSTTSTEPAPPPPTPSPDGDWPGSSTRATPGSPRSTCTCSPCWPRSFESFRSPR